jgi:hypothetical protein
LSRPELYDPAIAPLATRRARRQLSKQSLHRILLPQKGKGHPTGMNIAPLTQSDHPLGKRPNRLCFRQSGLDAIMRDQAANLVRQQQISVLGFAAQLNRLLCVTHRLLQRYQFSFITPFGAHRRLHQTGFKLHPETKTKLLQFFFNFVQRLFAEVAILQHFGLGLHR